MNLIIAPEPARWLQPLIDSLDGPSTVLAPWAIDARGWPLRSERFARRRPPTGVTVTTIPGWPVLEHLARRAAGPIAARLRLRQLLDVAVAGLLARWSASHVFVPSFAARRTLVAARALGVETTLLDDTPSLRKLHEDLDAAVRAFPRSGFLKNYRAPSDLPIQQEQEWVLAERVMTSSRLARKRLVRRGLTASRVGVLPEHRSPMSFVHDPSARAVLLAGTTASRYGLEVLLGALEHSDCDVYVRPGEGASAAALQHPRVRLVTVDAPRVCAVVAPSWVECTAHEAVAAAEAGVPVVVSNRACGWLEQSATVQLIRPGDVEGLRAQVLRVLPEGAPRRLHLLAQVG